jgi:hypothetical protein
MSLIREALRFFLYRDRRIKIPNQMRNDEYDMRSATESQRMVMRYRLARSPEEAQRLLNKYDVQTSEELSKILYIKRPGFIARIKRRFVVLVQRIEGHDTRDLIGAPKQKQRGN